MKILIVTQRWYPDTFGGSEHVAREQAVRFSLEGHQVLVLTQRRQNNFPAEEMINGSLRVVRYGEEKKFKRWGLSITDLLILPKIIRNLHGKNRFDVAILHHPYPAFGFFMAKINLPSLYIFHGSTFREVKFEGLRRKFDGILKIFRLFSIKLFTAFTYYVEKKVLEKANIITVFSDFSLKLLRETYPKINKNILKIGIGIDSKKFTPPADKDKIKETIGFARDSFIVLTVRRLTARMGLSELIVAAKEVKRFFPKIIFLIIGGGPLFLELSEQIKQLGLSENVQLVGTLPDNKLSLYYQAADLFVLPTVALEGLGMSTLEAMASGVPVIGTPVGATPEILKKVNVDFVTKSSKGEDIAYSIINFLKFNKEEKDFFGKKARQVVESDYVWDKAVKELEEILKSLNNNDSR